MGGSKSVSSHLDWDSSPSLYPFLLSIPCRLSVGTHPSRCFYYTVSGDLHSSNASSPKRHLSVVNSPKNSSSFRGRTFLEFRSKSRYHLPYFVFGSGFLVPSSSVVGFVSRHSDNSLAASSSHNLFYTV